MIIAHEVLDVAGQAIAVLQLPEELQPDRLDAFSFAVPSMSDFDKDESGPSPSRGDTIAKALKRSTKYKAQLKEHLRNDAAKARATEEVKRGAI